MFGPIRTADCWSGAKGGGVSFLFLDIRLFTRHRSAERMTDGLTSYLSIGDIWRYGPIWTADVGSASIEWRFYP